MDTDENPPLILKDHEVIRYLTLWSQRSGWTVDEQSFNLGRMSVALMLESQARILEEFGTSLSMILSNELIASALRDLLRSLEIDDDVLDAYDSVCTMKQADQTKYVPSDVPSELPSADVRASQPSGQHLASLLLPTQDELGLERKEYQKFLRLWGQRVEQIRSIEEGEAELREEYRSPE